LRILHIIIISVTESVTSHYRTDLGKEDLKTRQTTVNICNIKTFPHTTEFFPTKTINHKNVIKNHLVSLQSGRLPTFGLPELFPHHTHPHS